MKLIFASLSDEFKFAAGEIQALYPERFGNGGLAVSVRLDKSLAPGENKVEVNGKSASVCAGDIAGAMRAMGRLMGAALADEPESFAEKSFATLRATMPDCCRNAVPTIPTLKRLALRSALMGFNGMMLYMEDTYTIPSEPFFGYLRGRYTADELHDLSDYGDRIGVEVFPSIQGLAHLKQFLQWDCTEPYRDTDDILCVLAPETYDFLARSLDAVLAGFNSRRICLGMDEAWGLGTHRFEHRFGKMAGTEIMARHLERVMELVRARGLHPMIWSDMFFRLGSKTKNYYDPDWKMPEGIKDRIPADLEIAYWDYYHEDPKQYRTFIARHRQLGKLPVFAGGAWTWNLFWNALGFSIRTSDAALAACRAEGIRETICTLWGDDGQECDMETALPAMQHFAECLYLEKGKVSRRLRARNLRGSCGLEWTDAEAADRVNTNEFFEDRPERPSDAEKALFWQDPALALFDPICTDPAGAAAFYKKLSGRLARAAKKSPASAYLGFQAQVAKTLSLRFGLREEVRAAVLAGARDRAPELAARFAAVRKSVAKVRAIRAARWFERNKPFGWEVLDGRFGTLDARLDTCRDRILAWGRGELETLPEFTEKLLPIEPDGPAKKRLFCNSHSRTATPSVIF